MLRYIASGYRNISLIKRSYTTSKNDLFVAISELENLGIKMSHFPSVIAIGPQSSGKSSVLDAHCGIDILPKDMDMSTLKPIYMTTIRDVVPKIIVGDREFNDRNSAAEEVQRLNLNSLVKKISIRIHSPDVYNSHLIDLPGLFYVSKNNPDAPKQIKNMIRDNLKNKNYIPLVVTAGNTDPATNQGLQMVDRFDRSDDAIGVITKMDMVERQKTHVIENMLQNKKYNLGNGYTAVSLRNKSEIDDGMTVAEKIILEAEFFKSKPQFKPCGVMEMRKKISEVQYKHIRGNLDHLIKDIDLEISKLTTSQTFIDKIVNDKQKGLPSKLKFLVEKLVGSSLERSEFEERLKKEFNTRISSSVDSALEITDDNSGIEYSDKGVGIVEYYNKDPTIYKDDTFKDLFSYGMVSPIVINDSTIQDAYIKEMFLAYTLHSINFVIDDPIGKKRVLWNKQLSKYFDNLLQNETIQTVVYKITETMLLDFIYEDIDKNDMLTRSFAEYIIKEIGSEAYENKIKFSIEALVNSEKRPNISVIEIIRNITQLDPEKFKFCNYIFRNHRKVNIEIYGNAWNTAYVRAVSRKLADNCYRNVAVNLLDKMVERLLEVAVDMFNKDNALKEKDKIDAKIKHLNELKTIIAKYL